MSADVTLPDEFSDNSQTDTLVITLDGKPAASEIKFTENKSKTLEVTVKEDSSKLKKLDVNNLDYTLGPELEKYLEVSKKKKNGHPSVDHS